MEPVRVAGFDEVFNLCMGVEDGGPENSVVAAVVKRACKRLMQSKRAALAAFENAFNRSGEKSSCQVPQAANTITLIERQIGMLGELSGNAGQFVLQHYEDDLVPKHLWDELKPVIKEVIRDIAESKQL